MVMVAGAQSGVLENFYVGTFTSEGAEGIYLCTFDPGSGEIALKQVFKGVDDPSYLRKSQDGRFLFVVSRPPQKTDTTGGNVAAYRIMENGSLVFVNKQPTHGDDPCYTDVSSDGKWLVVANYGGGSVALFPLNGDGSLNPASSVVQHRGSGPDIKRQTMAHAHSIRFSKQSDIIYAADLGIDKLLAYKIDSQVNRLISASQPFVALPPGSGPRHFEFSDDGKYCYVVNELSSTVVVYKNQDNQLTVMQTITALPQNFSGVSYCADIHLSPDGKLVYASNRGNNSIVVFRRQEDGKLVTLKHVSTEGNWPRNFTLDPTGKYMLVANQRSHNIVVFRLENGIPVFTGKELKINAPVCLEF
jgi:6-phosphogluconolactonase